MATSQATTNQPFAARRLCPNIPEERMMRETGITFSKSGAGV